MHLSKLNTNVVNTELYVMSKYITYNNKMFMQTVISVSYHMKEPERKNINGGYHGCKQVTS